MSRKTKIRWTTLQVAVSQAEKNLMESLLESGRYGFTLEEVAERLISQSLREILRSGEIIQYSEHRADT